MPATTPAAPWLNVFNSLSEGERAAAIERVYYMRHSDASKVWNTYFDSLSDSEKANMVEVSTCTYSAADFARAREHLYDATRTISTSNSSMQRLASAETALLRIEQTLSKAKMGDNWHGRLHGTLRAANFRTIVSALVFPKLMGDTSMKERVVTEFADIREAFRRVLVAALENLRKRIITEDNQLLDAIGDALEDLRKYVTTDGLHDTDPDATERDVRLDPGFSF